MTMSPRLSSGAKSALRGPTATSKLPPRMSHHWSNFCRGVCLLCRMATRPANQALTRSSVWGVSAISGTRNRARRPSRMAWSMARRYTSVLPLPVTPWSRKERARRGVAASITPSPAGGGLGWGRSPKDASRAPVISARAYSCSAVSVNSPGRESGMGGGPPETRHQSVATSSFCHRARTAAVPNSRLASVSDRCRGGSRTASSNAVCFGDNDSSWLSPSGGEEGTR